MWVEIPTIKMGEHIIASTARQATENEISDCRELHSAGKCPHSVFIDKPAYMYDLRHCAICDRFIAFI